MKKKILIIGCADIGFLSALTSCLSSQECEVVSSEKLLEEEKKEMKFELKDYSYIEPDYVYTKEELEKHPFDKFINGRKKKRRKW